MGILMNNKYEFDVECYGYSGQLIDDMAFSNKDDAQIYINENYCGMDMDIKLYKRDFNSGCREEIKL